MTNVYIIYLGGSTLSGLIAADSCEEAFDEYSRKCGFKDRLELAKYYQGKLGWYSGIIEEGVSANQKTDTYFRISAKKITNNGKYKVAFKRGKYEDQFGLDGLVSIYKYVGFTTLSDDIDNQLMRAAAEETRRCVTMPTIVRSTAEEVKQRKKYKQTKE